MKAVNLSDFDYHLPDDRIAKYPLPKRDGSKLLVSKGGNIKDYNFTDMPSLLPKGARLVFNNTKVIPARLFFHKDTGALIQVFLLSPQSHDGIITSVMEAHGSCVWECMIGNKKKWKEAIIKATVHIGNEDVSLSAKLTNPEKGFVTFSWEADVSFAEIVKAFGEIPLPPYLNRDTEEVDKETYQTVYSEHDGAVAAPTAGLHFTARVLKDLEEKGFSKSFLTLHVGAGTFQPVKVENALEHHMHSEQIVVSKSFIQLMASSSETIIPVGTTSMRSLESLYWYGVMLSKDQNQTFGVPQMYPYQEHIILPSRQEAFGFIENYMSQKGLADLIGSTEIFILPGYDMKVCGGIITNFHQPKSTLLMLISALVGDHWKSMYQHALEKGYRFLSYGDSSLLLP